MSRNRKAAGGWTAVVPNGARLDLVSVEYERDAFPRITRCESYPLADGLVVALSRLRQSGKLTGRCATLLPQDGYQFLSTEAPTLPEVTPRAELKEAVRWKIKDMVDFPVATAGVDALPIPTQPGRPAQLLAVAANHSVLRPLIETFQNAKVDLAEITVAEIAQRNIASLFETPDRALALLCFGSKSGLLTLTCNGELHATRRIDVGAEELSRDKSLYERVVLDIQRSLDNFDRNFSQLSLQRLLVGPVPGADDFVSHLRDNLYQPVEALVINDGLDIEAAPMLANPTTLSDALPTIGVALGLGHDDADTGINLFDAGLQQQRDPWSARNFGYGLAASLIICVALGIWAHWNQSHIEQQLQAIEPQVKTAHDEALQLGKQITGYQPDARLQATLDDSRVRLESRTQVLALLRKGMAADNSNPAELMRGFARQIPNGLWLTGFSVDADNGALEIRGRTTDPRLIPEYVQRLNSEQAFQGRTFSALEITTPAAKTDTNAAAGAAGTAPPGASVASAPANGYLAQPAQASGQTPASGSAPGSGPPPILEFALTSAQSGTTAGGHP